MPTSKYKIGDEVKHDGVTYTVAGLEFSGDAGGFVYRLHEVYGDEDMDDIPEDEITPAPKSDKCVHIVVEMAQESGGEKEIVAVTPFRKMGDAARFLHERFLDARLWADADGGPGEFESDYTEGCSFVFVDNDGDLKEAHLSQELIRE